MAYPIFFEGVYKHFFIYLTEQKTSLFNPFNTFTFLVKTNKLLNKKMYSFEYKV